LSPGRNERGRGPFVAAILIAVFPTIVDVFYFLRLGARRDRLHGKLVELNLKSEYLRIFDC
jgi:hypothetical protein